MAKYDEKEWYLEHITVPPKYAQDIHTLLFYMIDNKRSWKFPQAAGVPFLKHFKFINKEKLEKMVEFVEIHFKTKLTDEQIDKAINVYYTLLIY